MRPMKIRELAGTKALITRMPRVPTSYHSFQDSTKVEIWTI